MKKQKIKSDKERQAIIKSLLDEIDNDILIQAEAEAKRLEDIRKIEDETVAMAEAIIKRRMKNIKAVPRFNSVDDLPF